LRITAPCRCRRSALKRIRTRPCGVMLVLDLAVFLRSRFQSLAPAITSRSVRVRVCIGQPITGCGRQSPAAHFRITDWQSASPFSIPRDHSLCWARGVGIGHVNTHVCPRAHQRSAVRLAIPHQARPSTDRHLGVSLLARFVPPCKSTGFAKLCASSAAATVVMRRVSDSSQSRTPRRR